MRPLALRGAGFLSASTPASQALRWEGASWAGVLGLFMEVTGRDMEENRSPFCICSHRGPRRGFTEGLILSRVDQSQVCYLRGP